MIDRATAQKYGVALRHCMKNVWGKSTTRQIPFFRRTKKKKEEGKGKVGSFGNGNLQVVNHQKRKEMNRQREGIWKSKIRRGGQPLQSSHQRAGSNMPSYRLVTKANTGLG